MNIAAVAPLPALNPNADFLDEPGAYALANKIRNYWQMRGFWPNVWVTKATMGQSETAADRVVFIVRSDLVNGRPR